jgi:hypothetical protein
LNAAKETAMSAQTEEDVLYEFVDARLKSPCGGSGVDVLFATTQRDGSANGAILVS